MHFAYLHYAGLNVLEVSEAGAVVNTDESGEMVVTGITGREEEKIDIPAEIFQEFNYSGV